MLRIPPSTCRATFRGREAPGATALDPAHIHRIGILIADRKAGSFALEVRRIGLA